MVRQYRIDRFNGMEILVCECFDRHIFTPEENDALFKFNEQFGDDVSKKFTNDEFREYLNEQLGLEGVEQFCSLRFPIPKYDPLPRLILRGPVMDNRIVSLQLEYVPSVLPPVVVDEVRRFYDFVEGLHWRDSISKQVEMYGSLFESQDD